jgi:transcriptional regulator with XRE-family HTH domain
MEQNVEISQLGKNIKRYTEEKGWNLNILKQESGVGYATLHDIVNGKSQNLKSDNIEKIATALEVSTDQLLGVEYEVIEKEVGDLEETINTLLESDFITIDDMKITDNDKEEIRDLIKFEIAAIRRRRKDNEKNSDL